MIDETAFETAWLYFEKHWKRGKMLSTDVVKGTIERYEAAKRTPPKNAFNDYCFRCRTSPCACPRTAP